MTRTERIVELDLLLQELKQERRMSDWVEAHKGVVVWTYRSFDADGGRFKSCISRDGKLMAEGKGNTEADARAHAFSHIFLNEEAARAAK